MSARERDGVRGMSERPARPKAEERPVARLSRAFGGGQCSINGLAHLLDGLLQRRRATLPVSLYLHQLEINVVDGPLAAGGERVNISCWIL